MDQVAPKTGKADLLAMPPNASTTEWRDPWEATKEARETLYRKNRDAEQFQRDLFVVSRRITDEINADPMEVQRLRKARQDAREGKASPRAADTNSN